MKDISIEMKWLKLLRSETLQITWRTDYNSATVRNIIFKNLARSI